MKSSHFTEYVQLLNILEVPQIKPGRCRRRAVSANYTEFGRGFENLISEIYPDARPHKRRKLKGASDLEEADKENVPPLQEEKRENEEEEEEEEEEEVERGEEEDEEDEEDKEDEEVEEGEEDVQ